MNKTSKSLGTDAIRKLVFRLAVPTVIAQIINVLYSIVDRIYIGHIRDVGADALTGLGITFPLILIISAFAAFVGFGAAPLAAIELGRKNTKKAEKYLGNGFTLLLIFAILMMFVLYAFNEPLLYLFGANAETIGYATDYLNIYLAGTIFVQLALGLNPFITSQGQAKIAMFSVLIGAVLNIILDPIFIFALDMGVKGAAIATIISQGASALWVVQFLRSEKSAIRLQKVNFHLEAPIVKTTLALGISSFIMQSTEGLVAITLNSQLQIYGGNLHIGAMTIILSVMQLIIIPISGFTQGTQPIVSYNFGANKKERVQEALKYIIGVSMLISTIACISAVFFPSFYARLFTVDADLIALVDARMPIFMAGIWIFGVQMACQSVFVALGEAKVSLFLAILRKIILLIPLAILLPRMYGVTGIYFSEPISDTVAAITSAVLFYILMKKRGILKKKQK